MRGISLNGPQMSGFIQKTRGFIQHSGKCLERRLKCIYLCIV